MVKTLIALFAMLRQSWALEVAAAVLIVAGLWVIWGGGAALIGAGVAVLLKSAEKDLPGRPK